MRGLSARLPPNSTRGSESHRRVRVLLDRLDVQTGPANRFPCGKKGTRLIRMACRLGAPCPPFRCLLELIILSFRRAPCLSIGRTASAVAKYWLKVDVVFRRGQYHVEAGLHMQLRKERDRNYLVVAWTTIIIRREITERPILHLEFCCRCAA